MAEKEAQTGVKVFVGFAGVFAVLVILLIIVAVNEGNSKIDQINQAGGNVEAGFFATLSEGLNGNNAEEIIEENVISEDVLENPQEDYDSDGIVDSEDVDVDDNGVLNSEEQKAVPTGICGDADWSGFIDTTDMQHIVSYAFEGVAVPEGVEADLNGDGVIDIFDVTIMTNYLFRGAEAPACGEISSPTEIIINSFTGPNYISANSIWNWSVNASDPEEGNLTYNVSWGDNKSDEYSGASGQSVIVSHRYSKGGKYFVIVKATNGEGLEAFANKTVEIPSVSTSFCDFWSNDSLGITEDSTIIARDIHGTLVGNSDQGVVSEGGFLIHVYGDDGTTSGIDEGPTSGENITFYKGEKPCVVIGGSNSWAYWGSKQITLDCQ